MNTDKEFANPRWAVRAWYKTGVEPPKEPGGLAFETWHTSESSRDIEFAAARSRSDIGQVEAVRI